MQTEDAELPDFSGKVVVFYAAGLPPGMDAGVTMQYAEFRRQGGRLFVVGRVPEGVSGDWASRLQCGVAWDSVAHYIVFESLDEMEKRAKAGKPSWLARLFGKAG